MTRAQMAVCILSAALTAVAIGQNNGVRLTDGSATFDYALQGTGTLPIVSNGASGVLPMNFQFSGPPLTPGTNWLPQGNWFYRLGGDNRERQFANASAQIPLGPNSVEYQFSTMYSGGTAAGIPVPGATGYMRYTVFDTGVDQARMRTEVCVENNTGAPLPVDLFCVLDIDVLATALGDTVAPLSVVGSDLLWTMTEGFGTATMRGYNATSAGLGNFSQTLAQMVDGNIDNFIPVGGSLPSVDAVAAMQYSAIVPPQSIVCFPVDVDISLVPEPLALGLALPLLVLRRRR